MRLKEHWRWERIKDVAQRVTVGFVGPQAPHFVEEGIPLLRGQNVRPGALDLASLRFIPRATHERWSKSSLQADDVVIVRVGYPGVAAVIPPGMGPLNAASLVIVRPNRDLLDPHFLAYLINSAWGRIAVSARLVGSAQQVLNTNAVADLEIQLPPIAEQRAIAGVLRAFDVLIENNQRRIDLLEQMAQAVYREWFVRFRYPGHGDATFVDSPAGPIPNGWEVLSASDLLEINPRLWVDRSVEHAFITMGDLSEHSMICFPSTTKAGSSGAKFQNGDTLFARITPCLENGKTGFVDALADGEVGRGSTEFIVLRGRRVGPTFTYLLARNGDFRANAIKSMSGASGRQRVRNECFDSYLVPVPPQPVLARFENAIAPTFGMSFALARTTQRAAALREHLLPDLVTGKIDVSHLDLDAAEALVA
jgi:type I restriction enzyme, S subunit